MRLYREEYGEGHPLLLLTGLGYAIWSWQRQLPAWSQSFRVIASSSSPRKASTAPSPSCSRDLTRVIENVRLVTIRTKGVDQ